MQYEVIEQTTIETTLKITLPQANVNAEVDRLLKKYSKTLAVPGFRKGKIPVSILKQRYGKSIIDEARDNLIEPHFSQALKESQIQAVGRPVVKPVTDDANDGFTFTVTFETMPIFNLEKYTGYELEQFELMVDDEMVDESINRLLQQHGQLEAVDKVAEESDHVAMEVLPLIDEYDQDERIEMLVMVTDNGPDAIYHDHLLGCAAGDDKKFDIKFSAAEKHTALKGKTIPCEVTITAIKNFKTPELTDEFLTSLNDENYSTIDELRIFTKDQIEKKIAERSHAVVLDELLEKIYEDNPFDVPETLIERQIEHQIQELIDRHSQQPNPPIDPAMKKIYGQYYRPSAIQSLKRDIVYTKVAAIMELTIEEDEVDQLIEETYQVNLNLMPAKNADTLRRRIFHLEWLRRVEAFLYDQQNVTVIKLTRGDWDAKYKPRNTELAESEDDGQPISDADYTDIPKSEPSSDSIDTDTDESQTEETKE